MAIAKYSYGFGDGQKPWKKKAHSLSILNFSSLSNLLRHKAFSTCCEKTVGMGLGIGSLLMSTTAGGFLLGVVASNSSQFGTDRFPYFNGDSIKYKSKIMT